MAANPCVFGVGEGGRHHNVALNHYGGLPMNPALRRGPPMDAQEVQSLIEKASFDVLERKGFSQINNDCGGATLSILKTFCPRGISTHSVNMTAQLGATLNGLGETGYSVLLLLRRNSFDQFVSKTRGYTHCSTAECGAQVAKQKVKLNLRDLKRFVDEREGAQRDCLANVTQFTARHHVVYYEDLERMMEVEIQASLLEFATNGELRVAIPEPNNTRLVRVLENRAKQATTKTSDPSRFNETIENWDAVVDAMNSWGARYSAMIPGRSEAQ